jgi:hypothetical protein
MITFTLTLVLSIVVLAGVYVCYVCSQADLIVFTSSSGREFTIDCSRWFGRSGTGEEISTAPYVFHVNEFLSDFLKSGKERIEFTPTDIRDGQVANPILASLQGLDYEMIRCRLRVVSGLDPVVNQGSQVGSIHLTEHSREVKLRTIFDAKAAAIAIEKLA